MRLMRRHRAFTLLELIVALAVVLVLGGIAYASYLTIRERANDNTAIALADQLAANLQHYAALNGGAYPANMAESTWDAVIAALGADTEFAATVPAIVATPGNLLVYTDAAGSTFQIEVEAAQGTGMVYCRDPNGLAALAAWNGAAGPWAGCP